MKRTISLLLALVMLASFLPIDAAALELGYVSLNVTAPTANSYPTFQATCNHDNYVVDTAYSNTINGVSWYDETVQERLTASDRFAEGHKYTVTVILTPTTGNKFALDTGVGIHTAVSGEINGSSAKVALSRDSALKVAVSYTFTLPAKITSVSVTDIIEPVTGQAPEYDGLVSDDGYELKSGTLGSFKNGVYWFDLTDSKLVKDGDKFVEGHQYRVFLCLVNSGGEYEFRTDFNGNPLVSASVNGKSAKAIKYLSESASEIINVYYDFPACTKPQASSVAIENLPIPQAGKNPEYTATVNGGIFSLASVNNTFTKNGICWSLKAREYDMTATDVFLSGSMYIATIRLNVKQGYELSQPITATVNGKAATATVSGGQVIVKYEVACPEYKIDKIDLKVDAPAIGNIPSEDIECVEPNLYTINNAAWYVDNKMMNPQDKFIAGKNYDLEVYVNANQIGWDYVASFADKVAVTVNGNKVSEKKVEKVGSSIKFTYTFTAAAAAKIGAVDVIGIDTPVAGKSPDYTAELPNSDTYKVDTTVNNKTTSKGVTWRNVTSGNAMVVGAEKFEKGNVYEVMVTVTPHNGYKFVTKKDGTPDVAGTINGKTASEILGRSEYEAIIVYKFPVTEAAPEAEDPTEDPTPEQDKPNTETGEGAGGDSDTTNTPKKSFVDVPKTAYYYEPVMWALAEGITGGTSENTFSPDASCTRAQVVTFLHRMVASPEPAAIDNPFKDVAKTAYYFKPVMWAYGSKITGGTGVGTFSPNASCTRAQVVTFLWRCAGQPKAKGNNNPFNDVKSSDYYYDAVLWAVEEGITGGTGVGTFSPNASCTRAQVVTFLYRFINK